MPLPVLLPEHEHADAIKAVLQFLSDASLHDTAELLTKQTQVEYDEDELPPNTLLNALHKHGRTKDVKANVSEDAAAENTVRKYLVDLQDRRLSVPDVSSEKILNGFSTKNLLSVSWSGPDAFAVSSSDCNIHLGRLDELTMTTVNCLLSSPAIAIQYNPLDPHLLAVGCMDGSAYLIDTAQHQVVAHFSDHDRRYVLRVCWCPEGDLLASAGSDHSLCIYGCVDGEWSLMRQMQFIGTPEGVVWHNIHRWLLLSVRGESFVRAYDADSFKLVHRYHVNTSIEDVSRFTVMDLTSHPQENFVFASTDHSRSILLDSNVPRPISSFYGTINDEYSTPRAGFGRSAVSVHCTSQDNTVVTWDIRNQKTVHRLAQHSAVIRDLDVNQATDQMLLCSYDKTVRVYSC